jgi:hypothetical protein
MNRLLLLAFVALTSCASLESRNQAALVGNWRYQDSRQTCDYSFVGDGTFSGKVAVGSRAVSKFKGRWSVKKDRLLYVYTSDALGRIPPGSTDQDHLLKVDRDSFLIEAADGSQRRYERQP